MSSPLTVCSYTSTSTTRAERLSFRANKDLAPQKDDLSDEQLFEDNRHFGVPAGKTFDR
jgi:hypothetical protein